jgi:diguanylate cyclase (GGDEF)-like protein
MQRPEIDLRTDAPVGDRSNCDRAGDERDGAGDRRDAISDERDLAADRRDDAGGVRDAAGDERDLAGDERDFVGDRRDVAGSERDAAAVRRDLRAERFEGSRWARTVASVQAALARRAAASDRSRAADDRRAGAIERKQAESDRGMSSTDRAAGSSERGRSGEDRDSASADRQSSAVDRETASFDGLTSAYLRDAGLVELHRDIARSRRDGQALIVAFIDVDRLKRVNDAHGHAAGDRLLVAVADTLRTKLRPYDLIIRYGGDEFVCALSGMSLADASRRFDQVNLALAAAPEKGSVSVGLAELEIGDRIEDVLARADESLYSQRSQHRGSPVAS